MRRVMIWALLAVPAVLVCLFVAHRLLERSRVDALVEAPATLRFGTAPDEIVVAFHSEGDGEERRHTLRLTRSGELLHSEDGAISWDLFGGGFVGAMDVDDDPEKELVVYGSLVRRGEDSLLWRSHYIDHEANGLVVHPFDLASESAKETARRWMQSHVMMSLEIAGAVILLLLYAGTLAVALLVVRALRRAHKPLSQAQG